MQSDEKQRLGRGIGCAGHERGPAIAMRPGLDQIRPVQYPFFAGAGRPDYTRSGGAACVPFKPGTVMIQSSIDGNGRKPQRGLEYLRVLCLAPPAGPGSVG